MRIESKETLEQLGLMDKAFVARKHALTTFVDLAGLEAPVTIATLEGDCYDILNPDLYYCAIGVKGEVWPVAKTVYDQSYTQDDGKDYKKMWERLRSIAVDLKEINETVEFLMPLDELLDQIESNHG